MKLILSITLLFLFSFSSAWALPECEGSPYKGDDLSKIKDWDNCEGVHTFTNGSRYEGEFKYALPNGLGTNTWPDGTKYVGEFKDGKRDGLGVFTYSNGNKYVGKFKNGNMHGQGTFTYPNGDKRVGVWENGKPLDN